MVCWSWIEQLPYISPVKKVQLQQFEDLRKAMIQFCLKLIVSKQKHGDDRNPDLRHYRIFAGSENALYLEVLLDPFREQLHLPPPPVDICNGAS